MPEIPGTLVQVPGGGMRYTLAWTDLRTEWCKFTSGTLEYRDSLPGHFLAKDEQRWRYGNGDVQWMGCTPHELAIWLRDGYNPPGLEVVSPLPVPVRKRRRIQWADEGHLSVDAALSGNDQYFQLQTPRESRPGMLVRAELGCSARTDGHALREYLIWLRALIATLEADGIDCAVALTMSMSELTTGYSGPVDIDILVKGENTRSDVRDWSPMLSPAAYRGFGFFAKALYSLKADRGRLSSGKGSLGRANRSFNVAWDHWTRELRVEFRDGMQRFDAATMTAKAEEALRQAK